MRPVAIEYGVNQYRFRYCSPRYRSIRPGRQSDSAAISNDRGRRGEATRLLPRRFPSPRPTKARVFNSRLGLTAADADVLQQALLEAARDRPQDLHPTQSDRYGQRYVVDFEMTPPGGTAVV